MRESPLRVAKKLLPPGLWNVARGLQSYLPGGSRQWASTGGTDGAASCYEVFLKHLTLTCEAGMRGLPGSVAEIGPGDSIGIGLAALLAGHELFQAWNGHWAVPGWQWRVIRGRRHYLINRLPYTAHRRFIERSFEIRTEPRFEQDGGIPDERFRVPFDGLDERERRTSGYFVVAVKRP